MSNSAITVTNTNIKMVEILKSVVQNKMSQ